MNNSQKTLSLPNVNQILRLHSSKSLPSCFKILYHPSQYFKKLNKIPLIEKKNSNPTIGELLGDDDLFHYHYHNQYSSSNFKRKYYYSRSFPHNRRKQRRSNYFQPQQEINPVYLYPTTYNYTPLPSYCYYCCYSTMTSYCPCLVSDCCTGLYQQEIYYETSTSHHDYQRSEKYK